MRVRLRAPGALGAIRLVVGLPTKRIWEAVRIDVRQLVVGIVGRIVRMRQLVVGRRWRRQAAVRVVGRCGAVLLVTRVAVG